MINIVKINYEENLKSLEKYTVKNRISPPEIL